WCRAGLRRRGTLRGLRLVTLVLRREEEPAGGLLGRGGLGRALACLRGRHGVRPGLLWRAATRGRRGKPAGVLLRTTRGLSRGLLRRGLLRRGLWWPARLRRSARLGVRRAGLWCSVLGRTVLGCPVRLRRPTGRRRAVRRRSTVHGGGPVGRALSRLRLLTRGALAAHPFDDGLRSRVGDARLLTGFVGSATSSTTGSPATGLFAVLGEQFGNCLLLPLAVA